MSAHQWPGFPLYFDSNRGKLIMKLNFAASEVHSLGVQACTGRNTGKNNLNRGTTGLLAVTSMMYLCKKTVLFGFGQPRGGTQAAPYHYYTVDAHP